MKPIPTVVLCGMVVTAITLVVASNRMSGGHVAPIAEARGAVVPTRVSLDANRTPISVSQSADHQSPRAPQPSIPRSSAANYLPAAQIFDDTFAAPPAGIRETSVQAMHQAFVREPTDPSWAPNVEAQIQGYLADPQQHPVADLVSTRCRSSTCEIFSIAPTKELNAQSLDYFQSRIFAMNKEAWWSTYGFVDPSFVVWMAPDGRAMIAAYLNARGAPSP